MKDTPAQTNIFDYLESVKGRDDGIAATLKAEGDVWRTAALEVIRRLPTGWQGIGEDIRKLVGDAGIGTPHHANCWGALIMTASRAGYLKRTEGWRTMTAAKSHARVSPIIERV